MRRESPMRHLVKVLFTSVALASGAPGAVAGGRGHHDEDCGGVLTSSHEGDVAVAWADRLIRSIRTERISPPPASRLIGYLGVALYESVVPGMPRHRSLGGQANGLDRLPRPPAGSVHWP